MKDAWLRAKEIAERLPRNAVWSFCITNIEDDAVFNVYAPREAWHGFRILLALTSPDCVYVSCDGRYPSYEEYTLDGLTLSLITPEEHNVRNEPDGPNTRTDCTDEPE